MPISTRAPAGGKHGGYGWSPDLPDQRDLLFAPNAGVMAKLAATPHFDLSTAKAMPPVWDQGQLGSCTAHSVGAAFVFAHRKSGHPAFDPSRLWIYYQERVIEGTVHQDAGAMLRDGFKVAAKLGVAPSSDWPYKIETFADKPAPKVAKDAIKHKALAYRSVMQELTSLKTALLGGYPVSFGFTVYTSFESAAVAASGNAPMPAHSEKTLGGHAVLLVGYDDPSQRFIVRNSWGKSWGKQGYFTLPYAYVTSPKLASDFWQVTIAS